MMFMKTIFALSFAALALAAPTPQDAAPPTPPDLLNNLLTGTFC
jgi:hypothetical protein